MILPPAELTFSSGELKQSAGSPGDCNVRGVTVDSIGAMILDNEVEDNIIKQQLILF